MLQVVAGRRAAALSAALALILCSAAAGAQTGAAAAGAAAEQPLDPSAPMEEWPDLGVDWPDMEQKRGRRSPTSPAPPPHRRRRRGAQLLLSGRRAGRGRGGARARPVPDALDARGISRQPANAAQIDRRARADAELLAELLRSHGYYDALVTTDVAAEAERRFRGDAERPARAALPFRRWCDAGARGGGRRRSGRAARGFAVNAQDPVNAETVQNAEAALRVELGRRGYAFAEVGEPEVVVDHETRTATLVLPVETGRRAPLRPCPGRGPAAVQRQSCRDDRPLPQGEPYGPTGSRICARRWSRPGSFVGHDPAGRAARAPTSSTSPSRSSRRRCARSPARLGYGTGEGRAARAQLAAPQPDPARRRGHLPRRRRHPRAARCRRSSGATISCAATRC